MTSQGDALRWNNLSFVERATERTSRMLSIDSVMTQPHTILRHHHGVVVMGVSVFETLSLILNANVAFAST
jgi:hypothetical protein